MPNRTSLGSQPIRNPRSGIRNQIHRLLPALLLALALPAAAQTGKRDAKLYLETSADLREEIWHWKLPSFKDYTVPPALKGYSSIVLARHTELDAGRAGRFSNNITEINRELVKLNDAAAVKQYSEVSFTQLRKSNGVGSVNKASTYIGVHVIKESGKVIDINADDMVLTKDERTDREAKLAIPDLQPGDMIDYYVAQELDVAQNLVAYPYYFTFYDDVPVLHYSIHCDIARRFATEFRTFNGAPDFKDTDSEEGGTLLDITANNLMIVPPGTFWVSPMRQFPLIEMNIVQGFKGPPGMREGKRLPGELYRNQPTDRVIRDEFSAIVDSKSAVLALLAAKFGRNSDVVEDYYRDLKKRDVPDDSLAAALYYMCRFDFLFNKKEAFDVGEFVNTPQQSINTSAYAHLLSEYFKKHDLDAELVLATSMYGPKMDEVVYNRDIEYLCNVRGKHNLIFGMYDFYSPAFYLPAAFEGAEGAIAVDTRGPHNLSSTRFDQRPIPLSRSAGSENVHLEKLAITPDMDNSQLSIARTTSLTGHYKDGEQKRLLLIEDFYNYERTFYNDDRSLSERLSESRRSRSVANELDAAFATARKKQKDAFTTEVKEWMEVDITDLKDAKILNPGVRHTAPSFDYSASFHVNNVMKRAGNNYLVEVGKLIGNPTKAEGKQRDRTIDIYGPYARTVRIEMQVQIPEGYTAEGLAELSKSVQNEAGHFTATARQDGNTVIITTEKLYAAARYPVKDWPQLLAVMDAASDWTSSKILLRKKG